jgi:hypothetical protein
MRCKSVPCDKMDKFEEGFPTGVYVATGGKDKPKLKMKALSDHCKQIRKRPNELSPEELEPFFGYPKY